MAVCAQHQGIVRLWWFSHLPHQARLFYSEVLALPGRGFYSKLMSLQGKIIFFNLAFMLPVRSQGGCVWEPPKVTLLCFGHFSAM